MLERPLYFVRRALRNMWQCPFLCSVAVGTVAVALAIMAFFAIVVLNVQQLTERWNKNVEVIAYFDQAPQSGVLDQWIQRIESLPEVAAVAYVDPRTAFERFRKRLGDEADLLEGLSSEVLPASLEIALKPASRNQQGVGTVVSWLQQQPAFADLQYGQQWLERFEAFLQLLKLAGAVLGGFLLFAALFIVSNTIKLTLYARRDELEVMSLVGGTPLFIKAPFLLEGALQGTFGGVLALLFSYALFTAFLEQGLSTVLLNTGLEGITFLPMAYQAVLVGSGTLLGFFGSLFSLRKLVRV